MTANARWQIFLLICALLVLLAMAEYLAWARTLVTLPEYGEIYREGVIGSPIYVNPLLSINDVDRDLCRLIYDGLTDFDSHGQAIPLLADWWEVSDDGRVYTFHLRPDVHWHDGAPFTAEDVLFTFGVIQSPGYAGPPELSDFWREVRVEATDMFAVRFTLPQPFAPFLSYTTVGLLPAHLLSGVSPEALPTHPFHQSPVGTGSFRVAEVTLEYILLERNPIDFRSRPYLDGIQFWFYTSAQALWEAYQAQKIDGLSRVPLEYLATALADESLTFHSAPLSGQAMVLLNLDSRLFQDPVVRQALLCATDRQALIAETLGGQGVAAHGPIPPFSWAYDPALQEYAYDPKRAAVLLSHAGWRIPEEGIARRKGGWPFSFDLLTDDAPQHIALAEMLSNQWAQIAVTAIPVAVTPSELVRRLQARDFEAAIYEWSRLPADPDLYALWHSTQIAPEGQNVAGLRDAWIDLALEEGRLQLDPAVRKRVYDRFQQRFAEILPALPLYHPVRNYAISQRVHGVQIGPLFDPSDRFRTIRQWYMATKRMPENAIR